MSHFYSSCQGGRGKATRAGHKTTSIRAMARCHELTVVLDGHYDKKTEKDVFTVTVTLDDPNLVVNPDIPQGDQDSTYIPVKVVVDNSTKTCEIIHDVKPGHKHNVKAEQAEFKEIALQF